MGHIVDNAIIMAAGLSSRFAPLSYEKPKALIRVRGEVLIERQIRQLQEAGIRDIILVVGYMKEQFDYLAGKYDVQIVENPDYDVRNNNSTIKAVENYLRNSYICSSDNYFIDNPFESEVDDAYYAAVFAPGDTKEWCMSFDADDTITDVRIGGHGEWFMLGHAFWNEEFSIAFTAILNDIYNQSQTAGLLWESIYMQHLDVLKLKIRKYPSDFIFEFDTLDELRTFDSSYIEKSGSVIMEKAAAQLGCSERELVGCAPLRDDLGNVAGFTFQCRGKKYTYDYRSGKLLDNRMQ